MPSHACARQQLRMVEGATRPLYFCPTCGRRWSRYTFTSGHAAWLSPENFDADGRQRKSLSELTAKG